MQINHIPAPLPRRNSESAPGARHDQPAGIEYRPSTPDHRNLTPGGLVVHRRTRWSPSLCNTVARLAGLGQAEVR